MARSFFSGWGVVKLSLMPQWMPAALNPWGAVTPPEMMFMEKTSLEENRYLWVAERGGRAYRPSPSSKPSIRFMFCTAAPEAPLPRLSNRAVMVVCSSWPQTISRSWLVPTKVSE